MNTKYEENVIKFWDKNDIFKKVLKKNSRNKNFVFYEGPPSANANPALHHVLSRSFKDVVLRYKTMRGFNVQRKAGWDTHGLPIEIALEKRLGFTKKNQIEEYGIEKFNKEARNMVWEYKKEWDRLTKRIGFWVDLEHPYITYEPKYIETLWYLIKKIYEEGLLYEGLKALPYCPRCETPLSSHELDQGYKKTTEESVYVKFKIKDKENTYFLAWTTTPWTLPSNAALAVGNIVYVKVATKNSENFILAKNRLSVLNEEYNVIEEISGYDLVGISYEPLWFSDLDTNKAYKTYMADFVSDADGTGIVHLAPFGVDDMNVFKKENIPFALNVSLRGEFAFRETNNGLFQKLQGKFVKNTDKDIIADLADKKLLYKTEMFEHDYPFCWRCQTPLLYYPKQSWFIAVTKKKVQLLKNNKSINWVPSHIKEGRFGEWLANIVDWTFSRDRYWGTPLPVWKCSKGHINVIGSLKDLGNHPNNNTFYVFRHGEAENNTLGLVVAFEKGRKSSVTKKGIKDVKESAKKLKDKKIDFIISSPLWRTRETAEILRKELNLSLDQVKVLEDFREIDIGEFNWKPEKEYSDIFNSPEERFSKKSKKGENLNDVKKRIMKGILKINKEYKDKNIIIVSHGDPLWMLRGAIAGYDEQKLISKKNSLYLRTGEFAKLKVPNWPFDRNGELNLHRPYIDNIVIPCSICGDPALRVKEVIDVWFDSGAMPFAQSHYPFENKDLIDENKFFPADYICEGVDQTRGWFYTLLSISTVINKGVSYKNVISLGHLLDEKGQKMSKSKGNIVNPWEITDAYGVDALRWYFYSVNQPGEPKLFSTKDLAVKKRIMLDTAENILSFLKLYADSKDFSSFSWNFKSSFVLDKWIMSRIRSDAINVKKYMDAYDITAAARKLEGLVNDMSNWYVRRSRRRMQKPESVSEYQEAIFTLFTVLYNLTLLLAPFMPFWSEKTYQELKSLLKSNQAALKNMELSAHMEKWPDMKSPDKNLEDSMDKARYIVSLALAERAMNGIKIRQPLYSLAISKKLNIKEEILGLMGEEINVKNVFVGDMPEDKIELDTNITPELKNEGLIKDLERLVQDLRKKKGFLPKNKVNLYIQIINGNTEDLKNLINDYEDNIKRETNIKSILLFKNTADMQKVVVGSWELSIGVSKL